MQQQPLMNFHKLLAVGLDDDSVPSTHSQTPQPHSPGLHAQGEWGQTVAENLIAICQIFLLPSSLFEQVFIQLRCSLQKIILFDCTAFLSTAMVLLIH